MATFLTGSSGKGVSGATDINITSWTATMTADYHETSHTGSSNYHEDIAGKLSLSGSL